MQRVLDRRLDWLVVFGEGPVEHRAGEEPSDALAVHDERSPGLRVGRLQRGLGVGHVALPLLVRRVPCGPRTRRVPRLALEVGGGAVVQDPAIERPAARPAVIEAHAGRIVLLGILDAGPPLREIAGFGIRAGVDPVAGGGRPVVLERAEGSHPLARCQIEAVDLLADLVQLRLQRILVVHRQRIQWRRELPALLGVELLHALVDVGQDPVVVAGALGCDGRLLPLHPAAAVNDRAVLLDPVRGRDHEHFGLDRLRVRAGPTPELRAGRRQRVHHRQPLEVGEGLHHLVGVGADAGRGHARQDDAFHLPLERLVVDRDPRRVGGGLGQIVERVVVFVRRRVAVPGLEQADDELPIVRAEEVPGVRVELLGRALGHVVVEVLLARGRDAQVAGQDLPGDRVVGIALDVGVTALGVHAAAWTSHVAEQELQNGGRANELAAGGVVREPDRVDDRHHLVGPAGLADDLRDLEELRLRDTGDRGDHLGGVARIVLAQELEYRAGMLELHVALGERHAGTGAGWSLAVSDDLLLRSLERGLSGGVALVGPRRGVVRALDRIVAAEQPLAEAEALLHEEGRVRVVLDVLVVDQVLLDDVADQAAEKGGVRAGPDPGIHIGHGRGPGEPRVDVDHLGAAAAADPAPRIELRLQEPLEPDRMSLGRIRPVDDDHVGVLNVTPVIRHRAPTECGRQTEDRGAVSDSGLLFYVHHPQGAHELGGQITFLAAEGGAARERDAFGTIDRVALGVLRDKRSVALLLDALRGLVEHLLPGDLLPLVASRGAVEGLGHAPAADRQLHRRGTLRAESALVDRAVGLALDLEELRVALGIFLGDGGYRAPAAAVRTQLVHVLRPVDPEVLLDLDRLGEVEAEGRGAQRARTDRAELDEIPSCHLGHGHVPPTKRERRWYRRSITEARSRTESFAWPITPAPRRSAPDDGRPRTG